MTAAQTPEQIAQQIAHDSDSDCMEDEDVRELKRMIAAAIRSAVNERLEMAISVLEPMAAARVGNERPSGGRDPFLYEQGIGMEAAVAAVRSLKIEEPQP